MMLRIVQNQWKYQVVPNSKNSLLPRTKLVKTYSSDKCRGARGSVARVTEFGMYVQTNVGEEVRERLKAGLCGWMVRERQSFLFHREAP